MNGDNVQQIVYTTVNLNLHSGIFIPLFAFPWPGKSPRAWVVQAGEQERSLRAREFRNQDDTELFQRACTKYEVLSTIEEPVECFVVYRHLGVKNTVMSAFTKAGESAGEGNVQFWAWHDPDPNTLTPVQSYPGEEASFRTRSQAQSMVSTVFSGLDARTVRYGETDRGDFVIARKPNPPMLALFLKGKVKNQDCCTYTMWKIDSKFNAYFTHHH
jgi:hypothetical protein